MTAAVVVVVVVIVIVVVVTVVVAVMARVLHTIDLFLFISPFFGLTALFAASAAGLLVVATRQHRGDRRADSSNFGFDGGEGRAFTVVFAVL